ncbi:hypothetical protein EXIGLDRAFT_758922 [Exidia glandulosa HHB12029]|uniref:Mediator of RNA polymerase II transcription subunit 7 n=1 Tax=Exidia glandulosa HHB12029 TaxID=1314781 RepID=A0A165QGD2_EXIGL|nr:hypothetical protein EXIGLDRAFT_758922 [Exidia glandulosa HHB12029]
MDDDELEGELRNPFPSPPSHYTRFTSQNLKLLSLLKTRVENGDAAPDDRQTTVLADQKDVPDWDLRLLEPPRVDWMLEDGEYSAFGDTWKLKEEVESLAKAGGTQLFPEDPSVDRRPHLKSILRTLLSSYTQLLDAVVQPPPTTSMGGDAAVPEWQAHLQWMHTMGQNLMAAANELRPAQARVNLEGMMRRQVELRREETKMIHEKCDTLERTLAALQQRTVSSLASTEPKASVEDTSASHPFFGYPHDAMDLEVLPLVNQDVLAWADAID